MTTSFRSFPPLSKEADAGIVTLLFRLFHAGAQVGPWPPPGPITDDELIDFHQALAQLPTTES